MSNKQKQVQYLVKQPQTVEAAAAPPRYQPPPQPPGAANGLKTFPPGASEPEAPYPKVPGDSAKQQPFPQQPPYPPGNLKPYPQQHYPYVGAPPPQPCLQRPRSEDLLRLARDPRVQIAAPAQRPEELPRVAHPNKIRISDEDFLRLPPVEMLKFVKKSEADSTRFTSEQNKHIQTLVHELRTLREANRRLGDDNQELRDLCCFLDDDRQKGRKVAREWQRFGRYTASVMRQEVSAYQSKLRELDDKQQELIKDNLELKELCLYLDEERSGAGMCSSCGANNGGGLRDDGDGSSSSTNADEPQVPPQFNENPTDVPRRSASRERILHENLTRQRSTFNDQTMQYVRNLEGKIKQLEEDKTALQNKLLQLPAEAPAVYSPALGGRPEAVVRALQVLEVRERLERDGRVDRDGNVDDNSSADMDDCEKALVREMCNVVWRKLEEGPSNGRR